VSRVKIDLACNDPDNGLFWDRVEQINIGELLVLSALRTPPTLRELPGAIRLAGKRWPVLGSKDWVGNWCWNRYVLDLDVAADFLVWLHGRRLFNCDQAETRLFNLWRLPEPLPREFVHRQLGKPSNGAVVL
jgi:hypothetical protein